MIYQRANRNQDQGLEMKIKEVGLETGGVLLDMEEVEGTVQRNQMIVRVHQEEKANIIDTIKLLHIETINQIKIE